MKKPSFYFSLVLLGLAGMAANSTADSLDHWTLRPAGTASTLRAVAYGTNQFVAVGDAGTILTSSDGTNWTNRPSGASGTLREVVFGNDRFVVVGDGGTLLSSLDGISWTGCNSGTSLNLFGAAFANGIFLVVGGPREKTDYIGDTALTSVDGVTWTGSNPGTGTMRGGMVILIETTWLIDLAGADSLFLESVGDFEAFRGGSNTRKFIRTSSDGINWTSSTTGNPDEFQGLAYGNGSFVAVGLAGAIQSRSGGLSWQRRGSGTANALWNVAFGNEAFVAVGDAGALVTSPDGIAWTQRRSGTPDGLYGITAGNNSFVAVGKGGTILQSAPLTSTLAPPVLSGRFNDGSFELTIAGSLGQSVSLQSADDLAGNIPWQPMVTLALTNSPAVWRDPPATNRPQRFYRAIVVP